MTDADRVQTLCLSLRYGCCDIMGTKATEGRSDMSHSSTLESLVARLPQWQWLQRTGHISSLVNNRNRE